MAEVSSAQNHKLSIGILTWRSKETLLNSIATHEREGIFDAFDDVLLFCNDYKNSEINFLRESRFSKLILSKANIGIGPAIRELIMHSRYNNFLFLEDDFISLAGKQSVSKIISALDLIINSEVKFVKLRNNSNPGDPCYSYNFIGRERSHEHGSMLTDAIYWYGRKTILAHPEVSLQSRMNCEYILASSKYSNYTNNPALYTKDFFYSAIAPYLGTGIQLETNIMESWRQSNHLVAHQLDGPFSHLRFDR
jgi:hypothetical protein